jgi:tetratricopeptide (TPR) repeat protein
MEYRDTTKKIPQIARELGVASILEGGVQRAGNRVRVFAQLIDAGADEHLWAETYDRELTVNNLLEIQSEMARSIVAALRATLTPEEASRLERKMTEDLPAYEAYLRAQAQLSVDDPDTRRRSIAELELAVSRDPTFAEAWASLAHANLRVFWFVEPDVTLRQRAREAIDRGRQIAPGLVSLDISEGYYHYWGFRDYERALAALAPAIRVAGGDGRLIELTSFIARRRGDFATAVSGMRRALELDPRQAGLYFTLAETYTLQERWSETLDVLEKGLLLAPEAVYGNNVKSWALIEKDRDLEGALDLFTRFGAWDVLYARLGWWIENARGEYSSALEHADLGDFADTKFSYLPPALQRGLTHLYAGDAPSAKRELEAARRYVERRRDQDPDDPRVHRSLCVIHGALRMTGAADRSCARAVEGLSRDAFEAGYLRVEIATGLALAGLNDRALDMIELYLREPSGYGPVRTELEPAFRGLRADPRFAALLDRSRHQTD